MLPLHTARGCHLWFDIRHTKKYTNYMSESASVTRWEDISEASKLIQLVNTLVAIQSSSLL